MKTELIVYKLLSFLLLPVAALFSLAGLSGLLAALSYPPLMIHVFLIACMVIYIIASFIFLTKGIDNNNRCKPVLRDWIRINGVITFILFLLVAISFAITKANPGLLEDGLKQWTDSAMMPPGASAADLQAAMKTAFDFFFALSIGLIIHVILTFHLMRRYRYLFAPEHTENE